MAHREDSWPEGFWLEDFWLEAEGLFVVPVEHLHAQGIAPPFRARLVHRAGVSEAWCDLFDAALRTAAERAADLARRAPTHWFPPRAQHVAIVRRGAPVRPYFQPFHKASWLLHEEDFDPQTSDVELAVHHLLLAERTGLVRDVVRAFAANLSYWLQRTDGEVARFQAAAARATRPDAAAARALAGALPWLRTVWHEVLRPPRFALPEGLTAVPGTGLIVPRSLVPRLEALLRACRDAVQTTVQQHFAAHSDTGGDPEQHVCDHLRAAAPRVLLTGAGGRLLWDCARPAEVDGARAELAGITRAAAESLCADLDVVGARSRTFVDALRDPAELPRPDPRTADQNGLCYMHLERREVAYNLREPGMHRLREPAPPYERRMLAARAVHEWGHLAAGGGWVDVPVHDRARHAALVAETAALYDDLLRRAPRGVARATAPRLAQLARGHASPGAALAALGLARVEDFQSNLLSQRFLEPAERETYVRNNVHTLLLDLPPEATYERLARYAYEFQYLRFAALDDPRAFLLRSTWFGEEFFAQDVLREEDLDRLLDLVTRTCDLYAVDEARFR